MDTSERTPPSIMWWLRFVWLATPLAVGAPLARAIESWSDPSRAAAEVLLWVGWGAGVIALLIPRPLALTLLRLVTLSVVAVSVATAATVPVVDAALGLATTMLFASLAVTTEVTTWMVNGAAYGGEHRIPLRTPALFAGVLAPLAGLLAAAGVSAGPLTIAAGKPVGGLALLAIGLPLAALSFRSLHTLSRRWLVVVPGGLVLHDPLVVANAVLLPRGLLEGARLVNGSLAPLWVDLRLAARRGTIVLTFREPVHLPLVQHHRRAFESTSADVVAVAVTRPGELLSELARRLS